MTDRFLPLEQPPVTDDPRLSEWLTRMMILINGAFTGTYRMDYQGRWQIDTLYTYHQVVVSEGETYICVNPDGSTEKPAPTLIGDPAWLSGEGDTPAWTTNNATAELTYLQRYTIEPDATIDGVITRGRFWVDEVNPNIFYSVWLARNVGTPEETIENVFPDNSYDTIGWQVFNSNEDAFLIPGNTFDFIVRKSDHASETTDTTQYSYVTPNNDRVPTTGEIVHASKAIDSLRINNTSQAGDYSAQLGAMQIGDKIEGAGIIWTINQIFPQTGYYEFEVTPTIQGTAGAGDFIFTTYQQVPVNYQIITDHYAASITEGGFSTTGYDGIVLDNNMYGIDIELQEAYISDDWEQLP